MSALTGIKKLKLNRPLASLLFIVVLSILVWPSLANALYVISSTPSDAFPSLSSSTYALASAADGSVYAGGNFTVVDAGVTHTGVIHILANGSIDPTFNTQVSTSVQALALDESTHSLYVGGTFTTVNGSSRTNLAKVDSLTGVLSSFAPAVSGGPVHALVFDGTNHLLYVGGAFTTLDTGISRNRLGAFNTQTGVVTSFNPNLDGQVTSLAVNPSTQAVVAAGAFSHVGATVRNYVAFFDSSGALTTTDLNPSSNVNALAFMPDGSNLFLGGAFTTIGGLNRTGLAQMNNLGAITAFNPTSATTIYALAYVPTLDTVFVGGDFSVAGGFSQNGFAAFAATDGSLQSFNPNMTNGTAYTMTAGGGDNYLYVAGLFTLGTHNNFMAFAITNQVPGSGGGSGSTTAPTTSSVGTKTAVATATVDHSLPAVGSNQTTEAPKQTTTPKKVVVVAQTPKVVKPAPAKNLWYYAKLTLILIAIIGIVRYIYRYIIRTS